VKGTIKMRFMKIACLGKDGSGFHISAKVFADLEDAKDLKKELEKSGYKDVTIFAIRSPSDKITWDYVKKYKIAV